MLPNPPQVLSRTERGTCLSFLSSSPRPFSAASSSPRTSFAHFVSRPGVWALGGNRRRFPVPEMILRDRAEQADFFCLFRSRERNGLRRETSAPSLAFFVTMKSFFPLLSSPRLTLLGLRSFLYPKLVSGSSDNSVQLVELEYCAAETGAVLPGVQIADTRLAYRKTSKSCCGRRLQGGCIPLRRNLRIGYPGLPLSSGTFLLVRAYYGLKPLRAGNSSVR
jgi:hypothetical protein